jgi:hypothetical protein
VFFPFSLYFYLLFYFLVVFLPFGICSPILFAGVWVLISTIDPTFLGTGFVVVLSTRVPKGFFFGDYCIAFVSSPLWLPLFS